MMPPALHMPGSGEKTTLEVRHYGTLAGSFLLYDDDGETFDYEKGDYSWTELSVAGGPDPNVDGTVSRISGEIFSYGKIVWKYMVP